ncbi:MAG: 30S ribosomal protein S6 [Clostridia bacterium]|nr:30S ribosomal protein S6 [Clostridia bacterium]MBQ8772726.1 30S ribosomal protein S6 [Clostridia bacterium]
MNSYELLYIIDNDLSEEAKEAVIAKISAVVTDNGGTIDGLDKWGTRKLAYAINYKTEGYYVLVNFTAPATLPVELERVMRITDGVIRFMNIAK